jgi:TolB-like protein/DNA-binding winged helix-turn-helix (wHTH) protein/Tfp pilus assembly protein PilF
MTSAKIRFRDYELDPDGFELRRAGHRIRLERKPLELLILLAEKQGQLVGREEIIEKIWGKNFFFDTENGINNAIRKVRSALNDDADQPRFVETAVGKGYKFISPVERGPEPSGSSTPEPAFPGKETQQSRWRLTWIPALGVAALITGAFVFNVAGIRSSILARGAPPIHSIAVLPLENLSGDPNQEYFVDSMTDILITDLAKMRDAKVISRTSAMQYKGTRRPLPEIARALGVDAVVEGSVVRSGSRVRITAQLIHAASDRHLWAESFEGAANDILSIQDEVARAIADRVQGQLGLHPRQPLTTGKPIDADTYELYLRGLYFFDKRNSEASKKSVEYFRKAIAAAPEFAPAYAGLAEALPAMHWFNGKPPVDAMPEAKAAAKRALELDNQLGRAHTALGSLLSLYDWNWGEAEKQLKQGLDLNPSDSLAHERYAMYLQSVGRLGEALVEAQRAQELDPLSFFMNRELARSFYLAGKYDEAMKQLRRSEELEPQSKDVVHNWIAWIYELQGKQKEAVELNLSEMADEGIPQAEINSLRKAYTKGGWEGYWTKWLQLQFAHSGHRASYDMALAEARLGHADKAWEWMEKAADQRNVFVTWMKVDPLFDRVRSHPGYKQLLQRINLAD